MSHASWGARVGAYLIDSLIVLPFFLIAYLVDGPATDATGTTASGGGPVFWILYLIGLGVWAYNRWFLAGKTGQSWGRKLLGLSLVGEQSGQPIGAGRAFLRDIVHILDGLPCYLGYLWPIWDAKRQTFSDKIMKTVVNR